LIHSQTSDRVKNRLQIHERTLSIPDITSDEYYRLPIVQFIVQKERTILKSQVPFVSVNSRWQIIRTHAVPFAYEDSKLFLDISSQLVARNGPEIRIFELVDEQNCGVIHGHLCLLLTHIISSSHHIKSRRCLMTLLGASSIQEIRDSCPYVQINKNRVFS